jgi:hypothetical protein
MRAGSGTPVRAIGLFEGQLVVIYDWPDGEDATAARVVTVWRQE